MNNFIELILEEVQKILGENYRVTYLEVDKKNSVSFPSLIITDKTKNSNTTPTLYLNKYYEMYESGENLYSIAMQIIDCYKNVKEKDFNVEAFMNFNVVKHFICFELINTKENEELLKKIPHREFLDLSICYYVKINHFVDRADFASITITNKHLDIWQTSEEDLYDLACINTPSLLGETLESMRKLLIGKCDSPIPFLDSDLYILSNKYFIRGTSVVLYSDLLEKFASLFEESFWLLPSSINEWLIVVDDGERSYDDYCEMVSSINEDEVPPEQILANHPYYFSKDTMTLSLKNKED